MSDMSSDLIIKQILQLQEIVLEDRKETNAHLSKLRENVHTLANDYHGVAALSQMQREQIQEIKQKQADVEKTLEDRLEKGFEGIREDMDTLDEKVQKMIPTNNVMNEIGMTIIKWGVPVVLATLAGSYVVQNTVSG